MKNLSKLEKHINHIGDRLVRCSEQCADIVNEPEKGILPRCLILEITGRSKNKRGVVIVGINPGQAPKKEQLALRNGSYTDIIKYWKENVSCNLGT